MEPESNIQKIEDLYLHGRVGSVEPPPPTPFGDIEQPQMPVPRTASETIREAGPIGDFLDITERVGILSGVRVVLNEAEVSSIRNIMARAVEREVLENLDKWREEHSLLKKKS